jgi:hypothetical protein
MLPTAARGQYYLLLRGVSDGPEGDPRVVTE